MIRYIALFFALVFLLSFVGCENTDNNDNGTLQSTVDMSSESFRYEVPVDWSDFIKTDGVIYNGDWRETEVSPDKIGSKIGEVSCGVPKVYTDGKGNLLNLEPENGASSICGIGTELFSVIDDDNSIAALVDGKYYLYTADQRTE